MTKRTHQRKTKSTKGNWQSTPMQQQELPSKEELEELIKQQQDPRHNQESVDEAGEDVELETPVEDKYTNDLDPQK